MLSVQNKLDLSSIAQMAYGHGSTSEGVKGGEGRIGLIDGRVVKFNTSWKDRMFGAKASVEMRDSCNALRSRLLKIAEDVGLSKDAMAAIRKQLGLSSNGDEVSTKKLLDRKVVAKVVDMIAGREANTVWGEVDRSETMKSSGDMSFGAVSERTAQRTALFYNNAGEGIATAVKKSFPTVTLEPKKIGELLDAIGVNKLADQVRLHSGDGILRDQIDEALAGVRDKFKEMLGVKESAADLLDEDSFSFETVLREVGDLLEAMLMNPTGGSVTIMESDEVADEAIGMMREDLKNKGLPDKFAPLENLNYHQMDMDFTRDIDYIIGDQTYKAGPKADVDGMHNSMIELFRADGKNVDIRALNVAVAIAHQGLATVAQAGTVKLSLPLGPVQSNADFTNFHQTISLEKSKKPDRYMVTYTKTHSGFDQLSNIALERIGGTTSVANLEGDTSKNKYTISYSFEFGFDKDGGIIFEMVKNPTHELTVPVRQELNYSE